MTQLDKPLNGKVALVTGAGRGIGAAIALQLAELGANLWLAGRTRPALEETATKLARLGVGTNIETCDVSDADAVETLARRVESGGGKLDILVNNQRTAAQAVSGGVAQDHRNEPDRCLPYDPSFQSDHDSTWWRAHHQHFIACR